MKSLKGEFTTPEEIYNEVQRQVRRYNGMYNRVNNEMLKEYGEKHPISVFDLQRSNIAPEQKEQAGDTAKGYRFYLEDSQGDRYSPFMFAYSGKMGEKLTVEHDETERGYYYFHNLEVSESSLFNLMNYYAESEVDSPGALDKRFGNADKFRIYPIEGIATGAQNLDEGFTAQDIYPTDSYTSEFTRDDMLKLVDYYRTTLGRKPPKS